MRADVKAPRRQKGQPMKDLRSHVSRIDLRADSEGDETFLAALYIAMFVDHAKKAKLIKLLGN